MASGLWLPDGSNSNDEAAFQALSLGRQGMADDDPAKAEMRLNRKVNMAKQGMGGDVTLASARPRDPMFYWRENNLPYDIEKPEVLKELRNICRKVYLTNPVIAACVDIFSKYPLVGMELKCKDKAVRQFHEDLFFDQLDYEEFLIDVGREHWTVGEAWPFGSFNELLGVWEDDELLNPDDIEVIVTPFSREPRFEMNLPKTLRVILEKKEPKWEYERLVTAYPELLHYMNPADPESRRMPVSSILLRQLKFKADTFNPRGVPILMRGIRYIIQEEMLNAAQEAVASRLYMPLILAKLGATAQDLGTTEPWIPTSGDLEEFESRLDAAFAADFRLLVHHFAVNMESVFGREVMPRLEADFDRITEKQLQVFGLSKTLLSGAEGGQTYAADALNRDLVTQLLTTWQRKLKRFYRDRALVVAEAQQHYDYETRGGRRYPVMEEVLEVAPDGSQRIVQQPKLLVPELDMKIMNLRSEETERQFIEALRESGVPISMRTRMVNVPVDLDDEIEVVREEQVAQAVEAQRTRKETYQKLRAEGLPIPQDLLDDFQAKTQDAHQAESVAATYPPAVQEPLPTIGTTDEATDALVPPQIVEDAEGEDEPIGEGIDNVIRLPKNQWGDESARPPESDEQRASMPKPASAAETGEGGLQVGPRHVGKRRTVSLDPNKPLDDQLPERVG